MCCVCIIDMLNIQLYWRVLDLWNEMYARTHVCVCVCVCVCYVYMYVCMCISGPENRD